MKKSITYSKQDILQELVYHDTWFIDYAFGRQHGQTNILTFDNDEAGNGEREFLRFKYHKDHLSIHSGLELTAEEKKIKFYFKNYSSIQLLVGDIVAFNEKYVSSFKLTRTIQK